MTVKVDKGNLFKKVVLIGFPYTNKNDTGRGIDRYLATIHKSFAEQGTYLRIIKDGVVKLKPTQFLKSFFKVFIALRKSDGKLFHAVDPLGTIIAALAMKKNIVTTIHDTIPLDGKVQMFNPLIFRMIKWSMQISIKISKKIIVPFESTKYKLVNKFHVPADKITIIHYALDLNLEQLEEVNIGQYRSDSNPKILFIGGGSPNDRGLDTVLKSYLEFIRDFPNASLTIVARRSTISDENQKLLDDAKSINIKFLEFVPDPQLLSFLSKFSVFLYPSELGFSFLVMQAMASGVPVVTLNSRDMKDFLEGAGILCNYNDIDCYVQALTKLLDKDFRKEIIKMQYERLRAFTLKSFYDQMSEFYMSALFDD